MVPERRRRAGQPQRGRAGEASEPGGAEPLPAVSEGKGRAEPACLRLAASCHALPFSSGPGAASVPPPPRRGPVPQGETGARSRVLLERGGWGRACPVPCCWYMGTEGR